MSDSHGSPGQKKQEPKELKLNDLVNGARKIFDNAEALYWEAVLLGEQGSLCRALFLHQISLEECAKVEILGAWATSLLMAIEVDTKKVTAALLKHANKNRTNAYMLEPSAEEKAAREKGDLGGSLSAFSKLQAEFHLKSNLAKNAALYVDCQNGAFVAPNERITTDMRNEIVERNKKFLAYANNNVEMLVRLQKNPEEMRETLQRLTKRLSEIKHRKDLEAALSEVMDEMLEIELAKRKRK